MTDDSRLTDEGFWDTYWEGSRLRLPAVMDRAPHRLQINAILDAFDAHLSPGADAVALEVGGAPGQYLAYMHRKFGYRCALLDFSATGCRLARRNFELLGIPVEVYERDLFAPGEIGPFDLVFSLGLVEHFDDLEGVATAHVRLVRAGGLLLLGAPNLRGVNRWFAARLGPRRLARVNTDALDLNRWDAFERNLGLERLFRGYVGGFEPGVFTVLEERTFRRLPVWAAARLLQTTVGRVRTLRRFNHPALSGYLLGLWRVHDPLGGRENRQPVSP